MVKTEMTRRDKRKAQGKLGSLACAFTAACCFGASPVATADVTMGSSEIIRADPGQAQAESDRLSAAERQARQVAADNAKVHTQVDEKKLNQALDFLNNIPDLQDPHATDSRDLEDPALAGQEYRYDASTGTTASYSLDADQAKLDALKRNPKLNYVPTYDVEAANRAREAARNYQNQGDAKGLAAAQAAARAAAGVSNNHSQGSTLSPGIAAIAERGALFEAPDLGPRIEINPNTKNEEPVEIKPVNTAPQQTVVGLTNRAPLVIPAPNRSQDYAPSKDLVTTTLQGNGNYVVKQQAVDPTKPANPLADPLYDPITNTYKDPSTLFGSAPPAKADELLAAVDPDQAMRSRLAQYDEELAAKRRLEGYLEPITDLTATDAVYKTIEPSKNAFYIDRPADGKALLDEIKKVEESIEGELGFVVLGENGIIALKDNAPFQLYGLSNFHLAYALVSLMSARGDTMDNTLTFNVKELNRKVYSPLAEVLYSSLGAAAARNSGLPEFAVQGGTKVGHTVSAADRRKAIAAAARQQNAGNAPIVKAPPRELHRLNVAQTSLLDEKLTLEELQKNGKVIHLAIGELLYYALGMSDSNASDILLSYLGALPAVELFDRTKGLMRTSLKNTDKEIYSSPDLGYNSQAPLYDTAKLYATYLVDSSISTPLRNAMDDIMYFNVEDREAIQKGVRNSIRRDSQDDIFTLKIYSREGRGGINSKGLRTVVSDMALVEYKDDRYIILIALRDIGGNEQKNLRTAENAIAFTSKILFDYLSNRPINQQNQVALPSSSLDGLRLDSD